MNKHQTDMLRRKSSIALVLSDIEAECIRHTTGEGFDEVHDDKHISGELATAAASYAQRVGVWFKRFSNHPPAGFTLEAYQSPAVTPEGWPWHSRWWKPKDPRRDLVRAGALIVQEIRRLDRLAASTRGAGEQA